ncbi:dolichyl-diphosphooligosaccharide--protein glycosyltransferase subunit 1 [Yamadazyma tenuis]|uniref:Dolichyl-diphosphooligosaccharide--protein glycosyltransferase subunit 1 n=1 Tax=Candida tenuis (strain ATCC 10573 / BCRC 21748 / CBS 615 / JCM 9827 / NBRC 10315 / NRRL Y-1498 / VKM Y-70) TaxID=590646 RepID=G3B306_CANTC|nr:Ribophorin I [Yamadazyma tenuis ATCC 10573]XP_006686660.1 uncharacterized protein CANTEDRAFT_114087 [Yamadazyma tenuis ATCC 10573]EGV64345.1 Ribophorin I [Yamadazyma tenuis ATCC 10573]EGV64346.1 hypothetical protein CANTEDRAFT_114087 [Yamadazyma tenuis ATCC 10573]WEJ96320.1 dolichyl-diphosphooligosaccharide--protein glycosyltransferase subunit 1 [Yamadazyma tenuis]
MKWTSIVLIQAALWNLCMAVSALDIPASWVNEHYTRTIDLKKSYVRETVLVEAKNVDSSPISEYYFSLPDGFGGMGNVSVLSAILDEQVPLEFDKLENNVFKLKLPIPLATNSRVSLRIRYVYMDVFSPIPRQIGMGDIQTLLFKVNKFNYSPYPTDDLTVLVEGMNKAKEMDILDKPDSETAELDVPEIPTVSEDGSWRLGPVDNVKPWSLKPVGLLYDHNKPLAKVHLLERGIWLPSSDINEFQIEEYYEVYNDGAELNSGFSRVEWIKGNYETARNHWALSHFEFPSTSALEFDDYYFTDKVGMVTTHKKIKNFLLFEPRFPLFGGWKYNFTFGFNQKFDNHLKKLDDETYILKVPLLNSALDLTYSTVNLNFYLPENAEFVNVSSPIAFQSIETDFEKSYLDVSDGHKKVTVVYKNLFEDVSKVDVLVMYKYTKANYWWKVFKISGFVFIGLVSYYLLQLVDLSL